MPRFSRRPASMLSSSSMTISQDTSDSTLKNPKLSPESMITVCESR